MNITILGAGNMACGIGTRLVAGGNSLTLMSRDPEEGATLAAELQGGAYNGALVQAAPFGSPIRDDVVILAVPYTAEAEIIQQYHAQLPGKILVNITNPLNATHDGLATPPGSSDAEEIARMVPPGAGWSRRSIPPSPERWSPGRWLVSCSMSSSPVTMQRRRRRSPNWSKRVGCVRLTQGRSRGLANWKEWAFSALRSRARSAPTS
jgi:NADP oxidoreductase coenzyme F420-dependent